MRQRLRIARDKFSIFDSIRELRGKIEYIIWTLHKASRPQWFEAPTKALLPAANSVSRYSTGLVVGVGADNGMICWIGPNITWEAQNFLE